MVEFSSGISRTNKKQWNVPLEILEPTKGVEFSPGNPGTKKGWNSPLATPEPTETVE